MSGLRGDQIQKKCTFQLKMCYKIHYHKILLQCVFCTTSRYYPGFPNYSLLSGEISILCLAFQTYKSDVSRIKSTKTWSYRSFPLVLKGFQQICRRGGSWRIFWGGAIWERSGQFLDGAGPRFLEKAIINFTSQFLFDLLFTGRQKYVVSLVIFYLCFWLISFY